MEFMSIGKFAKRMKVHVVCNTFHTQKLVVGYCRVLTPEQRKRNGCLKR